MNILLIRHGETELNAARVVQPADTPLSARGLAQADQLAQRLTTFGVHAVLSSDLPRARQTADAIVRATGASLATTAALHERSFGAWRGLPYEHLPTGALTLRDAPPDGESMAEFEARVAGAFADIVRRAAALPGLLAVVTHGLVIRAMLATHVQLPAGAQAPHHLGNTSLSVFDARAPHAASLVNCTEHLDAAVRDDPRALSGG
ncbi:MAG: histidine phosphatase family protein [Burkholderiales bacterium]